MPLDAILTNAPAMTPVQLYQLARSVGFPPDKAVTMTAIALKESNGYPGAYNGTGPDDSYGLFQINMIGNLGPARLAQFGLTDKSQLLDPVTNAQAAYKIWSGSDKNIDIAWAINSVDKTKFQAWLPTAEAAGMQAESYSGDYYTGNGTEPATGGTDWATGITNAVQAGVGDFGNMETFLMLGVAVVIIMVLTRKRA